MQLRVIYEVGLVFIWEIPCKIELTDWLYINIISSSTYIITVSTVSKNAISHRASWPVKC